MLPTDLLIFEPPRLSIALCIHQRANGRPAAVDWASSFSWCGNRRSSPPPWMSNSGPRYLPTIAEHSRCQPGRPRPYGVGHDAVSGSPSLCPFQSAKSRGSRLPRGSASAAASISSTRWLDSAAVLRPGPHVEVDVARAVGRRVGVARLDELLHQLDHLRHVAGRARLVGRRRAAEHVVGRVQRPLVGVGQRPPRDTGLLGLDQDLVVDVGEVGDDRHLVAGALHPAPQDVEDDLLADVPDVRRALDGEPAVVDARPGPRRAARSHGPRGSRCRTGAGVTGQG